MNQVPGQMDMFSMLEGVDRAELLRRAIRSLTLNEWITATLRDMVRHDAKTSDIAEFIKTFCVGLGGGCSSSDLTYHYSKSKGFEVIAPDEKTGKTYTWLQVAREYAAMYWEERALEDDEEEEEDDDP